MGRPPRDRPKNGITYRAKAPKVKPSAAAATADLYRGTAGRGCCGRVETAASGKLGAAAAAGGTASPEGAHLLGGTNLWSRFPILLNGTNRRWRR